MRRNRFPRAAGIAVIAFLGSCYGGLESPLGDEPLAGVYVLADIDGVALPADTPKESDTGNGMITAVVADTLHFFPGGVGAWSTVWRRRYLAGGALVDSIYFRDVFLYTREGDRLRIKYLRCYPDCVPSGYADEARIDASGAVTRMYPLGNVHPSDWRYQRIPAIAAP